jgi:hypothetical protein
MADGMIERLARILAEQAGLGDRWEERADQARELVRAMRVPTRPMAKAGADIPIGCCMTNTSDAGEVWEYMIDAALSEKVPVGS